MIFKRFIDFSETFVSQPASEYINLLLEVVEKEPTELGYEFGRWTAQRLSEHLAKETEIVLSSGQVKRLLKKRALHN